MDENELFDILERIRLKYLNDAFIFELVEINGGYQFLSKKNYHEVLNLLIAHKEKRKLSTASMETLAIIAYKQPITKSEIEQIRGVNCDYSVQKLLEKELISISGRSNAPGKPILYETSTVFMDYFGLRSTKDLPQLKDIQGNDNVIHPEDGIVGRGEAETEIIQADERQESSKVSNTESNSQEEENIPMPEQEESEENLDKASNLLENRDDLNDEENQNMN